VAERPTRSRSFLRELPVLLLVALGLALLVKTFLVQAFYIPSGSMEQTLHGCRGCNGDRVLVNKLVYDVRDVHRGEIVVFSGEGSWGSNEEVVAAQQGGALRQLLTSVTRFVGVGPPGETDYIKRVIGLPGDRVACCSEDGRVMVQPAGQERPYELVEPYVFNDNNEPFCAAGTGAQACPPGAEGVLVPEGRLWVMGDHRGASSDSRSHRSDPGNGTIPIDEVVGRAFVIVWPVTRLDVLEVPQTFDGGR
jgi:signal peptidase I